MERYVNLVHSWDNHALVYHGSSSRFMDTNKIQGSLRYTDQLTMNTWFQDQCQQLCQCLCPSPSSPQPAPGWQRPRWPNILVFSFWALLCLEKRSKGGEDKLNCQRNRSRERNVMGNSDDGASMEFLQLCVLTPFSIPDTSVHLPCIPRQITLPALHFPTSRGSFLHFQRDTLYFFVRHAFEIDDVVWNILWVFYPNSREISDPKLMGLVEKDLKTGFTPIEKHNFRELAGLGRKNWDAGHISQCNFLSQ